MSADPIFQPLEFPKLTIKNRIFRSSISGKFDNYDGSGTQARLNWETKFARGGAGAIISSFVPIHVRGRIQPNYAMIDSDDKIPFWRSVGEACHKNDFHLQAKISAIDYGNALYPWEKPGDDLETTINFFQWAERDGCDALHVSIGSLFPHPLLPSGALPLDEAGWWYGSMASSGVRGYWPNYTFFHFRALRPLFLALWNRTKKKHPIEGVCMDASKWVKERVNVPVINTGGYQRASVIRGQFRRTSATPSRSPGRSSPTTTWRRSSNRARKSRSGPAHSVIAAWST